MPPSEEAKRAYWSLMKARMAPLRKIRVSSRSKTTALITLIPPPDADVQAEVNTASERTARPPLGGRVAVPETSAGQHDAHEIGGVPGPQLFHHSRPMHFDGARRN